MITAVLKLGYRFFCDSSCMHAMSATSGDKSSRGVTSRRQRIRYPCGTCDKACGVDTIECSSCGIWSHRQCVPLSNELFRRFSESEIAFRCRRCACQGTTFDYSASLQRYVQYFYFAGCTHVRNHIVCKILGADICPPRTPVP